MILIHNSFVNIIRVDIIRGNIIRGNRRVSNIQSNNNVK